MTEQVEESLRLIDDLKFFLATAPANWQENQVIRRYYLNHDEGFVSCVYWNNLYFITGTDIVRCIVYKFEHFGRKIIDRKKFEEGIFSDLRNLKCGTDAILEMPKSLFLEFLYKNSCLRTQKKQKVFFWFSVPHDKLFADALERDLKKESIGQKPTTIANTEPSLSFTYDEKNPLYHQLVAHLDNQKKLLPNLYDEFSPVDMKQNQTIQQQTITQPMNPMNMMGMPMPMPMTMAPNQIPNSQVQSIPSNITNNEIIEKEEDDDFPLDYFQTDKLNLNTNNLLLEEPNYDYVDPNIFFNGNFNNDLLIDQTKPFNYMGAMPNMMNGGLSAIGPGNMSASMNLNLNLGNMSAGGNLNHVSGPSSYLNHISSADRYENNDHAKNEVNNDIEENNLDNIENFNGVENEGENENGNDQEIENEEYDYYPNMMNQMNMNIPMNQMSQLNQMGMPMNGMGIPMNNMNSMLQMNQMNQMNVMNPMNGMQMGMNMGMMNHMNGMNQLQLQNMNMPMYQYNPNDYPMQMHQQIQMGQMPMNAMHMSQMYPNMMGFPSGQGANPTSGNFRRNTNVNSNQNSNLNQSQEIQIQNRRKNPSVLQHRINKKNPSQSNINTNNLQTNLSKLNPNHSVDDKRDTEENEDSYSIPTPESNIENKYRDGENDLDNFIKYEN